MKTASLLLAAALIAVLSPSTALAFGWTYIPETKELIGSTGEEEGDTDFRATCKPDKHAEIGIGAQDGVGQGNGEAVSVTLATAAHSVKLDGKSKKSPNFEMTAGVELQTQVDRSHAIFQLLADPGAIKVTGTPKPLSWPATGRAKAAAAFMKACFGQ